MKKSFVLVGIVLLVLIIDQAIKIWVKTNMYIGEDSFLHWSSTPYWGRIHFVENDGMAFGIQIWGPYGKLILSLFRIVAVGFLVYFIQKLIQAKASMGLLISFALILAGAIGNIIDSAFYGLIFSASPEYNSVVAEFMPESGGYAPFLHGKVVDMLYFPMYDGFLPNWFPFWGGESFEFFKPVFNIADVSISTGVISILLFQRSFFSNDPLSDQPTPATELINETPPAETLSNVENDVKEKIDEEIKTNLEEVEEIKKDDGIES